MNSIQENAGNKSNQMNKISFKGVSVLGWCSWSVVVVVFFSFVYCFNKQNSKVARLESKISQLSDFKSKSDSLVKLPFREGILELRLLTLEQTVKAQSDSIALYKEQVKEVEKQKNFLSDIYSDNSAWFIGIVSLVVVLVVGYSVYSNKEDLKEVKLIVDNKISELHSKFVEERKFMIDFFDEKSKEYKKNIDILNSKLNAGLVDIYFVSSFFYPKLLKDINVSDVEDRFSIQIAAATANIFLNELLQSEDNNNVDLAFGRIIEIYRSTEDVEIRKKMKKTYLSSIYNMDTLKFEKKYKLFLDSLKENTLLDLN